MADVLDPSTRENLARLIVDRGGPYERSGPQIAALFRNARWPEPVDSEGSARVPWVVELLAERAGDRQAIAGLLCRLCDQREYDDPRTAAEIRDAVNQLIGLEGLSVDYREGCLALVDGPPVGEPSASHTPIELEVDLTEIVADPRMGDLLRSRLKEVEACRRNGAHFAAIVTLGSLLEGALYAVLSERDATRSMERSTRVTGPVRTAGSRPPEVRHGERDRRAEPTLAELIDSAHRQGLIQRDARDFLSVLREYRNFVHPRAQLERVLNPDADTVTICWNVAVMTLNDLGATIRAVRSVRRAGS